MRAGTWVSVPLTRVAAAQLAALHTPVSLWLLKLCCEDGHYLNGGGGGGRGPRLVLVGKTS